MNSELLRKALEKVGNPNVLVNVVSRRVRQLNTVGGAGSRPLVESSGLGVADVALKEIGEGALAWDLLQENAGSDVSLESRLQA